MNQNQVDLKDEFSMVEVEKTERNLHDFALSVMLPHALVVGVVVAGGYHSIGEVLLSWIHLLVFVGYLGGVYFTQLDVLKMNQQFTFFGFYLINFLILCITLAKSKN